MPCTPCNGVARTIPPLAEARGVGSADPEYSGPDKWQRPVAIPVQNPAYRSAVFFILTYEETLHRLDSTLPYGVSAFFIYPS